MSPTPPPVAGVELTAGHARHYASRLKLDLTSQLARECGRSWIVFHVAAALFGLLTGAALWAVL